VEDNVFRLSRGGPLAKISKRTSSASPSTHRRAVSTLHAARSSRLSLTSAARVHQPPASAEIGPFSNCRWSHWCRHARAGVGNCRAISGTAPRWSAAISGGLTRESVGGEASWRKHHVVPRPGHSPSAEHPKPASGKIACGRRHEERVQAATRHATALFAAWKSA